MTTHTTGVIASSHAAERCDRLRRCVLFEARREGETACRDLEHAVTLAAREHVHRDARGQVRVAVRGEEVRDEVDAYPRDERAGTCRLCELELLLARAGEGELDRLPRTEPSSEKRLVPNVKADVGGGTAFEDAEPEPERAETRCRRRTPRVASP